MVGEYIRGAMAASTTASTKTTKSMGRGRTCGPMGVPTREAGRMANNTVRVYTDRWTVGNVSASGRTAREFLGKMNYKNSRRFKEKQRLMNEFLVINMALTYNLTIST